MAPSILDSITPNTNSVKYFEIRLEENPLVLRGNLNNASGVVLKGSVVLCLSQPLRVQGLRLRFTGEKRLGFTEAAPANSAYRKVQEVFIKKVWEFEAGGRTLPADNHEWPFELALPGTTPESIEGLVNSWIVYRLKATIERGLMQQNILERKHLRVIRTLNPSDLELSVGMSVASLWKDKIDYSIETNSKAAIFGTIVTVNFRLVPLAKGLVMETVQTRVEETHELKGTEGVKVYRLKGRPRLVVEDKWRVAENATTQEVMTSTGHPMEGYLFSRHLDLPRNLRDCMQTVDTSGISIKHHLAFVVQMRNLDGHLSEVNAALPLQIFISPLLTIDEDNNLTTQNPRAMDAGALNAMAPPGYGEHQFDQLYSDVDPSGFQTPAGMMSGAATPMGSLSRNASMRNLESMDEDGSGDVIVNTLRNRLDNINTTEDSQAIRDRTQAMSSTDMSPPRDQVLLPPHRRTSAQSQSIRASEEDDVLPSGMQTPMQTHVEYSAEDLARVPSYTTALQSRPNIPIDSALPNYQAATSTPDSSPPLP